MQENIQTTLDIESIFAVAAQEAVRISPAITVDSDPVVLFTSEPGEPVRAFVSAWVEVMALALGTPQEPRDAHH